MSTQNIQILTYKMYMCHFCVFYSPSIIALDVNSQMLKKCLGFYIRTLAWDLCSKPGPFLIAKIVTECWGTCNSEGGECTTYERLSLREDVTQLRGR
jgi:hypothetical protein